ncbi:NAD-dependent epimerase [Chryseomicrobium excrementi]|uniref:NAD-dependent epimerase n=1 Tax=Chryseomicrobium excrementi TaxID=2041346 RepID=A0A2M9F0C3_9BACL|nr:NAD-dependent epimerase/dehydratase family protein [Chryseomicrobium excrementi]PJK16911.1 NAD-dependent epimerase [Chryseomicrobium excrementi]
MKRILITGKNSYVGTKFMEWVSQWPDEYQVEAISVRGDDWKQHNFSGYDCVLHVAGIAHVSTDPKMEDLYYKVNRDLTIKIAKHAKNNGVKHFIFMSSIIVYGDGDKELNVITKDKAPNPSNFYGDSKLQAEKLLHEIEDESFRVAVVRPPMIYGPNSKGNFPKLLKLAKLTPIFPAYDNQRSMLFIDNLSEFIRLVTDSQDRGLFLPQNREYVNTSELVRLAAEQQGKKILLTRLFNPLIFLLVSRVNVVNKMFGNLVYVKEDNEKYQTADFVNSIKRSL